MLWNLFFSRSWELNSDRFGDILGVLDSPDLRDWSVPIDDPAYDSQDPERINETVRRHMVPARCIVVLAGAYSSYKQWLDIEIRAAKDMGKNVVVIETPENKENSKFIKDNANFFIEKWDLELIRNTIVKACK